MTFTEFLSKFNLKMTTYYDPNYMIIENLVTGDKEFLAKTDLLILKKDLEDITNEIYGTRW